MGECAGCRVDRFRGGCAGDSGRLPDQTHLYSIGFDGKRLSLLSPENGDHTVSISPDGAYFVDSYSRPDLSGESVLRRTTNGAKVRAIETTDARASWAQCVCTTQPTERRRPSGRASP